MNTILVVDDDAMFRTIMKRHLQNMGFEVLENDSGMHVTDQITQYKPVLCLIDIVMDEKEGLETIREIQDLPYRPKIIAVSSNNIYLEFATAMGADDSLLKPVSPNTLRAALDRIGVSAGNE